MYGFDNSFAAKTMIDEILGKTLPIGAIVDSRTLFNVIVKSCNTLGKRRQIDLHAIRESHVKGELRHLAWVPGTENAADGMTKGIVKDNHPLWKLMVTNKLELTPTGWIENAKMNNQGNLNYIQIGKTSECGATSKTSTASSKKGRYNQVAWQLTF